MQNAEVVVLRSEYTSLVRIAAGLMDVVRSGAACNPLTMVHMAKEAREAARKVASKIEKLMRSVGQKALDLLKGVTTWITKKVPGMSFLDSCLNSAFR